ncbi:MAG: YraN family protein [Candidatus Kapaibacterium sp.]
MSNTREKGARGEDVAVAFLESRGYRVLRTNFRLGRIGEIDVVCTDGRMLVFVEVKMRLTAEYGRPEDAVGPRKQRQLRRIAHAYLHINRVTDTECRFDVVAIEFRDGQRYVRHWKNAFF